MLSLLSLGSGAETVSGKGNACGDTVMTVASVNMHFHGMNVSPQCHGDDVIHTIVNPGQSFHYKIKIPTDEPPGMYWYHQHIHGISSHGVQGGASGAIEVEGIANYQPVVQGLPQRFLVFRDQPLQNPPGAGPTPTEVPFWDVSLNYVPVSYPKYVPGVIQMQAGTQEFWRVVNASADTVADLQLVYDGVAQPVREVALDGVPIGSQDGKQQGYTITKHDVYIPPAGRAEFIVTAPSASVKSAMFITRRIDTGPAGDNDTQRPLAQIQLTNDPKKLPRPIVATAAPVHAQRFEGVTDAMVTAHRSLYFDEFIAANKNAPGAGGTLFFITVKGQFDQVYEPYNPPAIVTHKGAVEDWTIENHTQEVHEFHIHQIHFQLLEINGVPVPPKQRQWYDTYQVGYYTGSGPFPSIKVRMDFRGAVEGEFVYHCHILDHEDAGMMANILVLPPDRSPRHVRTGVPVHQARLTPQIRAKKGTAHA
jgi:FtsP/CotA-like multicopper oxidase with cupredoxin domain